MVSNVTARSGREPGKSPGINAIPEQEAGQFYEGVLAALGIDRKDMPCILEVAEGGVIQFTRRLTEHEMADLMVPLTPDGANGILHG